MSYKQIVVFIEGNDDERFLNRVVKPELEKKYSVVVPYKYSNKTNKKINSFLNTIKCLGFSDYIFLIDMDSSPCVSFKKNKLITKKNVETEKIVVVIKEIESWYIAGLNESISQKLGIPSYDNTNNFDKEQFDKMKPKKFDSRIDFMQEILNYFQIKTAKKKNNSFKYFFAKI